MSWVRDGEVATRVQEWEAARLEEKERIAAVLAELRPADGTDTALGPVVAAPQPLAAKPHPVAAALRPASPLGPSGSSSAAATERRLALMERQMAAMRVALANVVDENRFLRLEVDVMREATLGNTTQEEALRALELIGRRAGTQEKKLSVCTQCLTRTACFACHACRSVEYCTSRCQMQGFGVHVALCRHITQSM